VKRRKGKGKRGIEKKGRRIRGKKDGKEAGKRR